jgi:16S rRNA (uracil1498-N3)-methyltransferase
VRVFDGDGREYAARIDRVTRREVLLSLGGSLVPREESPLRLVLALAALKGDRMELVIQKATELGVAEIWPLVTGRTDPAARPALRGSRRERWEKVVSGAAEQSGRAVVPALADTATFGNLLRRPFDGPRVLLLETPGLPGLHTLPSPEKALLLVAGPPGGWQEREVALARRDGFECVGLGPRTLRTETAAIAALAIAQALWGDLGR